MTKLFNFISGFLFVVGGSLVVLNATITGAVTGYTQNDYSFVVLLVGIALILTSLLFFASKQLDFLNSEITNNNMKKSNIPEKFEDYKNSKLEKKDKFNY